MNAKSYLVKLVADETNSTKVWNSRKPLQVGFPARWTVETAEGGVRIRAIGKAGEPLKTGERFLKDSEIEKNASVILVPSSADGEGFRMELKPVERMAAASSENETDENASLLALRIFHCKGEWSVDASALRGKYVARYENQKAFSITGNSTGLYNDSEVITLEALQSGVMIGKKVLQKGERDTFTREEAAGLVIVYRGTDWKIATFKPSTSDMLAVPAAAADKESILFRKVLTGSAIAVLLLFFMSFLVPTPEPEKPMEKMRIVLTPKKAKGKATAAPKGAADARDFSIGQNGSKKSAGKKGSGQKMAKSNEPAPSKKAKSKSVAKAEAKSAAKTPVKKVAKAEPKAPSKAKTVAKTAAPAAPKQNTAPAKVAQKVVTNAPKSRTASTGARPVPAPQSELFKAFSSSEFKSASRSLVSGGVSGARSGGGSESAAEARSFGSASGSGRGGMGSAGGVSTRSASVSGLGGGGGNGDGGPGSSGPGYGRGSNSKVSGQGRSLVSLDTGSSDVSEGLSKDAVGRVIHAHWNEVKYCYDSAALRDANGVEGHLTLDFSIGAPGAVQTAAVGNTSVSSQRLHNCIVGRLKSWRFPRPKGGVTVAVSYPIMFNKLTR